MDTWQRVLRLVKATYVEDRRSAPLSINDEHLSSHWRVRPISRDDMIVSKDIFLKDKQSGTAAI